MKKIISLFTFCALLLSFVSCSTVRVVDSWKGDNISSLRGKRILVIARTANDQARIAFEEEISKKMRESGLDATESFKKFPKLTPDKQLTQEQIEMVKSIIQGEGYDGVVLSVLKDVQEATRVESDGGYYAGASYSSYYPMYYGGFYGYYSHPMSYSSYGNYVPSSTTVRTSKTFVLETVAYNLDQPETNQLVAVVTSKVEDPDSVYDTAEDYAKAIAKGLMNKK